jgi:hypothetical protein
MGASAFRDLKGFGEQSIDLNTIRLDSFRELFEPTFVSFERETEPTRRDSQSPTLQYEAQPGEKCQGLGLFSH